MVDMDCNTCRWQVGEKGECKKYDDCFDCPMCGHGGRCKCLMVGTNSDCPYWEPMKEDKE